MIQKKTDTHFLFNKVSKKQSDMQRRASRGRGKAALDMVIHGLENQTWHNRRAAEIQGAALCRSAEDTWKAETAPVPAFDFGVWSAIKSTTSNRTGSLTFSIGDFSQIVCCVLRKSHFLLSKIFWPLIISRMACFHMASKQRNIILGFGGISVLCKIRPLFLKPNL